MFRLIQMKKIKSDLTKGYTTALAAAVFLSTTAIFIRYLSETFHLPALVLAFWRDVFVAVTLMPVLGVLAPALLRVKRQHLIYLVAYGLILALFNSMWTFSVALNGAAVATVLVYCSSGFTALLGWWLLKERLDWAKLLAIAFCLGGCLLVSGALNQNSWRANLTGIFTGVLSGLCYAIYSLMGRSAAQRGLNPWSTLLYTFSFAAVFLLIVNLLPGGLIVGAVDHPIANLFWLGKSLVGWGVLFLLAAIPTVAGFGLYNTSLTYLPSSVANLIVTLEPVFTTVTAYILLGERLNWPQASGALMILGGVIFLRVYEGRLVKRPI
jgi:drug/metabolite transporter (DMT)-like permease